MKKVVEFKSSMNEKVVEFKNSMNNKGASEKVVKLNDDKQYCTFIYYIRLTSYQMYIKKLYTVIFSIL